MARLKALALLFASCGLSLSLCSCMTSVGIAPAEGFVYDKTYGTMYVSPEFAKDFNVGKLNNYRCFKASKVTVPLPYTFGAVSFGWGDVSTKRIMEEAKFNKLIYAHFKRTSVATVYTNYEITAYGE